MTTNDRRLYAKITLDFADSPKIAPLSDRAFREYIEALLWSRRLMTDGIIPASMVTRKFSPDALIELTTNGGEGQPSIVLREDRSAEIHDFSEHQSTREQIEKLSAAGKKGALARHGKGASTSAKSKSSAIRKPIASESQSEVLYESHGQTETETETITTLARKRATRIDENFDLDDGLREYAKTKAPAIDVEREREQFVNYWLAASGKNAVKIDWRRAFMTWLVNAQRFAEERGWKPDLSQTTQSETSQQQLLAWLSARGVSLDEWNKNKSNETWVDWVKSLDAKP